MEIPVYTTIIKKINVEFLPLEKIADVKTGLQTGENEYYLYKEKSAIGPYKIIDQNKVLTENELNKISKNSELRKKIVKDGISNKLFNGKTIVPIEKGGSSDIEEGRLRNYYAPTEFYIDWSEKNVKRMKTLTIADKKRLHGEKNISKNDEKSLTAVLRNIDCYFNKGITFSRVGLYSPTYRINSGSIIETAGNGIFLKEKFNKKLSNEYLLGMLCSKLLRYIIKNFVNNTVGSQVDDIKKNPIPLNSKYQNEIEDLVKEIIKKQEVDSEYSYQKKEQIEIDRLVFKTFGFDEDLINEVENWFARKYPKLVLSN